MGKGRVGNRLRIPRPTLPVSSLRLLLPYLRPYRCRSLGAAAALLLAAGLVLALGQGIRGLIDHGFAAGSLAHLDRAALVMFAVVAALAGATFARFYLVSWLGERVAADLRRDTFDRVISLSPAFFETARVGDILTREAVVASVDVDPAKIERLRSKAAVRARKGATAHAGAHPREMKGSPK